MATRRASDPAEIIDLVDPSPRDHPSRHVLKRNRVSGFDGRLTWCHVEDAEARDPHRTDSVVIAIIIAIYFHRTADAPRNLGPRDRAIVTLQSPEDRSHVVEGLWKNSTIAARPSRDWGDYVVESPPFEQTMIVEASMPRSGPDRGPIVASSRRKMWPDCGGFIS